VQNVAENPMSHTTHFITKEETRCALYTVFARLIFSPTYFAHPKF